MSKRSSSPTLFDEVLQINISKLKEWGYLHPDQIKTSKIYWSRNGERIASIAIEANTSCDNPYVELNYKYGDIPRKYKVRLVSVPSNLGKGEVWYFSCPQTGKRCRILYSIDGWFFHREAFCGVYYESQIWSKKMRDLERVYGILFKIDKLHEELYTPYFKHYYAGQPTKRYIRINKKLHEASQISIEEYTKAILGIL